MSLLTSASPWNAGGETSNKRVSTLRKTIKKTSGLSDSNIDYSAKPNSLQGTDYEKGDLSDGSLEEKRGHFLHYPPEENKTKKVLELINNMTPDNDGSYLANFNPPSYPTNTSPGNPVQNVAIQKIRGDDPIPSMQNEFQLTPPNLQFQKKDSNVSPSNTDEFSNYRQVYRQPSLNQGQKGYMGSITSTGGYDQINTKLMDKINYMIHMLEQQQNERTDNMMEEFILYTLLGVFIIFVLDAFARSGHGKYVR
jgi:hypothetical protein